MIYRYAVKYPSRVTVTRDSKSTFQEALAHPILRASHQLRLEALPDFFVVNLFTMFYLPDAYRFFRFIGEYGASRIAQLHIDDAFFPDGWPAATTVPLFKTLASCKRLEELTVTINVDDLLGMDTYRAEYPGVRALVPAREVCGRPALAAMLELRGLRKVTLVCTGRCYVSKPEVQEWLEELGTWVEGKVLQAAE